MNYIKIDLNNLEELPIGVEVLVFVTKVGYLIGKFENISANSKLELALVEAHTYDIWRVEDITHYIVIEAPKDELH